MNPVLEPHTTYMSIDSFNPQQHSHELLESLLIGREPLLQTLTARIKESAKQSGIMRHPLLIGARGMGKSHLVAVLYHRLRKDQEFDPLFYIAWLDEDAWYSSCYRDLLIAILETIQRAYNFNGLAPRLNSLMNMPLDQEELAAEQLLIESMGDRTLLVILENADKVFSKLGGEGRSKLQAIMTRASMLFLATSTTPFKAMSGQNGSFYAMFEAYALEPFSLDEAVSLMSKLAVQHGNEDLLEAIRHQDGWGRIQAIHALAGGRARIYVELYYFLLRTSLLDIALLFRSLMDTMTPYYQERMLSLSPVQQKIVDVLRRQDGAASVKEISRLCSKSPQSISRELKTLKDLDYVHDSPVGREAYYELTEPLMRLCLNYKATKNDTTSLLAEFLSVLYSKSLLAFKDELDLWVPTCSLDAYDLRKFDIQDDFYEALEMAVEKILKSLREEFDDAVSSGDPEKAVIKLNKIIEMEPNNTDHWYDKVYYLNELGRPEEIVECLDTFINTIDATEPAAWHLKSIAHFDLDEVDKALEASGEALKYDPQAPALNQWYASYLKRCDRIAEARDYLEKALMLRGEPQDASDWIQKGHILFYLERYDDSIKAYKNALESDLAHVDAWGCLTIAVMGHGQNRFAEGIKLIEKSLELFPKEAKLWQLAGTSYARVGRLRDTYVAYKKSLELNPDDINTRENLARLLSILGQHNDALQAYTELEKVGTKAQQFAIQLGYANALMATGRWDEGTARLEGTIERFENWNGEDLHIISILMLWTQNPDIWRRYIEVWILIFKNHGRLSQLGHGLIHRICYLAIPWFSQEASDAWYKMWHELASGYDELKISLRLLKAAISYRSNRDTRVLLALPKEEREILQSRIANLWRDDHDKPDEFQTWVDDFIGIVDYLYSHLLATYDVSSPQLSELHYLLPGQWTPLNKQEAGRVLHLTLTQDKSGVSILMREGLQVQRVEKRSVAFSNWALYRISVIQGSRYGAIDLMASDEEAQILDGQSSTIYALVKRGIIQPDRAEEEYTRFFSSTLRSAEGRFEIIDCQDDISLLISPPDPWRFERLDEEGPVFIGYVLYRNALYKSIIRLHSSEPGVVEVLTDELIDTDLPIRQEVFDGPIRFIKEETAKRRVPGRPRRAKRRLST